MPCNHLASQLESLRSLQSTLAQQSLREHTLEEANQAIHEAFTPELIQFQYEQAREILGDRNFFTPEKCLRAFASTLITRQHFETLVPIPFTLAELQKAKELDITVFYKHPLTLEQMDKNFRFVHTGMRIRKNDLPEEYKQNARWLYFADDSDVAAVPEELYTKPLQPGWVMSQRNPTHYMSNFHDQTAELLSTAQEWFPSTANLEHSLEITRLHQELSAAGLSPDKLANPATAEVAALQSSLDFRASLEELLYFTNVQHCYRNDANFIQNGIGSIITSSLIEDNPATLCLIRDSYGNSRVSVDTIPYSESWHRNHGAYFRVSKENI